MTVLHHPRSNSVPTPRRHLRRLAVFALALPALAACSGDTDGIQPTGDAVEQIDTGDLPDTPEDIYIGPEVVTFDSAGSDTAPDAAADTADTSVVEPNCNLAPFPFFCPCDINSQCASGYCVQAADDEAGMRCSQACQEECPNGWECRGLSAGGDPIFVCQPPIVTLCDACERDADCRLVGAKCVGYDDGTYCGQQCTRAEDCPNGYSCEDVLNNLGQVIATQCLRSSGSCNCPDGTNYETDPDNCGVCGNVCTFAGAQALCSGAQCELGPCVGPHVNLNGLANDGCEYDCAFVGDEDEPDAVCNGSSCDQNCDGIDGSYDLGIFVSETGASRGDGTAASPLNSIPAGIAMAKSTGKPHVYVTAGTYAGEVSLQEGVSVFGGYSNDGLWRRNLSQFRSILTNSSGTNSIRVVIADGLGATGRTVIDGFDIQAGNNVNAGGSSYAIWMRNVGANVIVRNVNAVGGNGGAGTVGTAGGKGNDGETGGSGTTPQDYECWCEDYGALTGGGGGASNCPSGRNAAGGRGAHTVEGDSCTNAANGNVGQSSPSGASGGPAETKGVDGSSGGAGAEGSGGTAAGSVSGSGFWSGDAGAPGGTGTNGVGGGGGGSGKTKKSNNVACGFTNTFWWGGAGGGGGSGGCGGTGGAAGGAGGGSFGIFLFNASPTLQASKFGHKNGGNGGKGGAAGAGGVGKGGGGGGTGYDGAQNGTNGGRGGSGGNGGRGGHGGGGSGGVAYGLYGAGSGSSPACAGVTYDPPGSGGTGGLGGAAGGSGGNGGAGGSEGDRNGNFGTCR